MFLAEGVRVVTVGQQQHLDIHALGQQHVSTTHRSLDARLVAVI